MGEAFDVLISPQKRRTGVSDIIKKDSILYLVLFKLINTLSKPMIAAGVDEDFSNHAR